MRGLANSKAKTLSIKYHLLDSQVCSREELTFNENEIEGIDIEWT